MARPKMDYITTKELSDILAVLQRYGRARISPKVRDIIDTTELPQSNTDKKELVITIRKYLNEQLPIFVYGTLRTGGRWWKTFLKGFEKGTKKAKLEGYGIHYYIWGNYPVMKKEAGGLVLGELKYIKPQNYKSVMGGVDNLELSSGYIKRIVTIKKGKKEIEAFAYLYTRDIPAKSFLPISHGDFNKFHKQYRKKRGK